MTTPRPMELWSDTHGPKTFAEGPIRTAPEPRVREVSSQGDRHPGRSLLDG